MKKWIWLVLACCMTNILHAQQFGGNPSSVQWLQINTDAARIIFPKALEEKAQRTARILQLLQNNYSSTIGDQKHKIDIVLHNETMVSNGYVGLAPYRSEFYLTPPQHPFGLGAVEWADKLAVHEFRHVQQYNNFNKGLSRLGSVIAGQEGRAVMNAAAVPDWFFEGDAVFNETQLTRQGRGALPLFMSSYHTLHNLGRSYSYMKMRNGSLRHYVPDHYDLGYLLVAYGRSKYGEDIWRKITDDASRFRQLFYPFQGAVKKNTGIAFPVFVSNAMQFYKDQWQKEAVESTEWITAVEKNNVVDYRYPYSLADGSIIVLKNSYKQIPAFYKIHADKHEEKIAVRDIAISDYFSYNNGKIVYAAYQPDARWGFREYNSIKIVDVATKEENIIAARGKYFAPDISLDGQKVVAVSVDEQMQSDIVIMSTSGVKLDSVKGEGLFFSNPKFAADGKHFYAAARNQSGEMALMKYGTAPVELLPFANNIISYLKVQGDTILYTQSNNSRDEVWAIIDGKEKKGPYRLASFSTGLYQATILPGGKLVSSAFTADGYRLAAFQPSWTASSAIPLKPLYAEGAFKPADHTAIDDWFMRSRYAPLPVTKYKKATGLLNFHSWRPYYENPEYSFTVYGENVLNTLRSELAYTYNENEGSHRAGYNGVYGGSYLQPVFGISNTWERSARLNPTTTVNWNELAGYAGLQLPLNLTRGKHYRYLNFLATYNINHVKWTGAAKGILRDRQVNYITGRISYSGQAQKALQQIYPRWAHAFTLQYRSSVSNTARQFLALGSLYFPGLSGNHNLVLTAAYHGRDTMNQYVFSNNFPFARGYTSVDFPRMWKLSANYHLPLAYPDWGFGQIVYFLRARANLFYDYSIGKSLRTGIRNPFHTVGAELHFDTRWWNQHPVSFGVRYSRLLNNEFGRVTQPNVWEIILPVNLF